MLTPRERLKARLQPMTGDTAWVLLRWARRWLWQHAWQRPVVDSVAPHPLSVYEELVGTLRHNGHAELLLGSAHLAKRHRPDRLNVVLRHDVDFDPRPLFAMTELEVRLGIRSTIYVRADGEAYRLADYQEPLRELVRQGFELGLHSSAYRDRASIPLFQKELCVFQECLGFPPTIMTTHGLYPFPLTLAVRLERFLRELARQRIGGILSDEFPGYGFDVGIADSNFSRGRTYTYLTPEFRRLPSLPVGRRVQVLTHPEYWKR